MCVKIKGSFNLPAWLNLQVSWDPICLWSEEIKTPRKVLPVQLIALSERCVKVVLLILIRNPAM